MKPVPKTTVINKQSCIINKHKRASSTGTTGDESYYTTDDDDLEELETDLSSLKNSYEHVNIVCNGMFSTYDDDLESTPAASINCNLPVSDLCSDNTKVPSSESKDKISWESLSEASDNSDPTKEFNGEKKGDCDVLTIRLQSELENAKKELKLRDEEIERLSRIRTDVETELEDLTASLFQVSAKLLQKCQYFLRGGGVTPSRSRLGYKNSREVLESIGPHLYLDRRL